MKLMMIRVGALVALTLGVVRPAAAATPVCVQVEVKQWQRVQAPQAAPAQPAPKVKETAPPASTKDVQLGTSGPRGAKEPGNSPAPMPTSKDNVGGISFAPDEPELVPPATDGTSTAPRETVPTPSAERPAPYAPFLFPPRPPKPGIDPALYLKRMLEYEVTHEPGYAAVQKGCKEHLVVELYALDDGFTVFARFSENEREEKVDQVALTEFVPLAQRVARALLYDVSISDTITRENVLDADSVTALKRVRGRGHFVLGMGTMVRVGYLDTAQGALEPVARERRVITPLSLQAGLRYKMRSWGFDAFGRVNIGTSSTGVRDNELGGHVDYGWGLGAGIRFLKYADAPGISSLYYGGGADFELAIFKGIRARASYGDERENLVGGGLNLNALLGYEFLRSSVAHFFVQGELQIPTYQFSDEESYSEINAWMPGALAQVGVAF
jgi:hypothetical protein